ncbi:MAG: hypothetical protein FWD48_02975 [Oscillospiraceae bacterium]|nr:hypothetical protein [Oscillospiraceae bacterium]
MPKITAQMLSNMLLSSPFTKEGKSKYDSMAPFFKKESLTTKQWRSEYLSKIYANPYFIEEQYNYENDNEEDDESKIIKRYRDDFRSMHKTAFDTFEKDMIGDSDENTLQKSLYLIIGSVGSGKTSFAHKLISERKEILHIFESDFEYTNIDNVRFLENDYTVSDINSINALKLILLENIGKCFRELQDSDEYIWVYRIPLLKDLIIRIDELCKIYYKYFNNDEHNLNDISVYKKFFEHLNKALELGSIRQIGEHILNYISISILGNTTDEKEQLEYLAGILLRLYFCLSKIQSSYKTNNLNKKFALLIDNIEYSLYEESKEDRIPINPIYESHIYIILLAIHEATKKFSERIGKIKSALSYNETNPAAIILTMRECTFGILQNMWRTNALAFIINQPHISYVDVSEWFDNETIFKNRIVYFTGHDSIENVFTDKRWEMSVGVTAYFNIIKDRSDSIWGLHNFVSLFYNNSKRLVYERFIGKFLTLYENINEKDVKSIKYLHDSYNPLTFFNEKWGLIKQAKDISSDEYRASINLCRKYLIRLLLDFVNSHNFCNFKKLGHDIGNPHRYNSYTRRVLVYLLKCLQEKPGGGGDEVQELYEFIPASILIRDLIECDSNITQFNIASTVDNEHISNFVNVLWQLNLSAFNDTFGANYLFIEIPKGGCFNKDELLAFVKYDWQNFKTINGNEEGIKETPRVDIRLTTAGQIYSLFIPDFEYFTCRYHDKSNALLTYYDSRALREHLKNVFDSTKKCIETIKETEKKIHTKDIKWHYSFIKENGDKIKRSHSQRLINSHTRYLGNFKKYLRSNLCSNLGETAIKNMEVAINEYISLYNELK